MTDAALLADERAGSGDREIAEFFARRVGGRLLREPAQQPLDRFGDHALEPRGPVPTGTPREAAVLVPVLDRPGGLSVLLTERASTLRQHSGQIAFPGGRCDPDDPGPIATAMREAREEIGLDPDRVRPLGFLDSYLTGTGYLIVPVVALIRPGPPAVPNPEEVADVFEVPLGFLLDEANHELHVARRPDDGTVRAYWAMPFGSRYIWGATAGMIRNLGERLRGIDL